MRRGGGIDVRYFRLSLRVPEFLLVGFARQVSLKNNLGRHLDLAQIAPWLNLRRSVG